MQEGPKKPCIRWCPDLPMRRGNFERGNGHVRRQLLFILKIAPSRLSPYIYIGPKMAPYFLSAVNAKDPHHCHSTDNYYF